jgi:hypothetical protein
VPAGTRSLAFICEDPDAPQAVPYVHWILYNLPPGPPATGRLSIPPGLSRDVRPAEIPEAVQGRNDFGEIGYDGPAPPPGHGDHHYHFRLYALDDVLPVSENLTKDELLHAIKGNVLATGELVGIFGR